MKTMLDSKTKFFFDTYLAEAGKSKSNSLFKMIADSKGTRQTEIARTIRRMPYKEFMQTKYWRLVAIQVKRDAGWRCSLCGCKSNLVVHHTDYKTHGYEMYRFKKLQCVCQKCHKRIHELSKNKKNQITSQAA